MTLQVKYEPVNPITNKLPFEQYLSDAPTCIFRSDKPISAIANLYIDSVQILTDPIEKFNAKLFRDKSGVRLARVLQYILKMIIYAFLEKPG